MFEYSWCLFLGRCHWSALRTFAWTGSRITKSLPHETLCAADNMMCIVAQCCECQPSSSIYTFEPDNVWRPTWTTQLSWFFAYYGHESTQTSRLLTSPPPWTGNSVSCTYLCHCRSGPPFKSTFVYEQAEAPGARYHVSSCIMCSKA